MNRDPEHEHLPPEPWVTKRQLADHLSVTPRWIELQQLHGLPRWSTGGHEPLSHLRGRGLAAGAIRLALRGASGPQFLAEGGPLVRAASPSFASRRLDATYLSRFGPQDDLSRSGDQIENRG